MSISTYTVKRGDSLWAIAEAYPSSIAGNGILAKINTLRSLNNIKNDLIFPNQVLILSGSGSSSSSSSSSLTVIGPALQAEDATGRAVFATWTWSRASTAGYTVRWTQYLYDKWTGSDKNIDHPEDMYCYDTFNADEQATKVRFQVRPYYKSGDNNEVTYWSDVEWSTVKEYDFSNNAPLKPPDPKTKIEDKTLTMFLENFVAVNYDAVGVKFNVVRDNADSVHTSGVIEADPDSNYLAHTFTVEYGHSYTVRCCAINSKNKVSAWSNFSVAVGTRPSIPALKEDACRRVKRSDGTIAVYLEWTEVRNAEKYKIEYTTLEEDFTNGSGNFQTKETTDDRTSIEITGIEGGKDYYFRVKAVNSNGESDPSPKNVKIPIGEPPAAPTTWSNANSAFMWDGVSEQAPNEKMELNWTHNSRDGSAQTYAQLSLKINNDDWVSYTFENTTNTTTGEQTDVETFTYGEAISYKGELHVKMDTSKLYLKNSKIQWKVRTAGVTDAFSDTDWSVERTIYIYEKPTLVLSMVKDLATESGIIETLDSFPFYIRAEVDLESYEIQRPIGYHLRVISNDYYKTVDDEGRTKTVNAGDYVYSKYFDTDEVLIVEMSANNLDLESGIPYTVRCSADMSTGLSVDNEYDFSVNWVDVQYTIDADITVDTDVFTATITPMCKDTDGNYIENVELSIYRREYDGTLTEIATNIPNNGTSVTDPHPALDYARYRLIARDTLTGAISFYDKVGYPIHGTSVIIQWDEAWSTFDISDSNSVEGPAWSGSMLRLNYNIDVSGTRKREVELINYAGREHPVSYYGTHTGETATWNVTIPKDDTETIYALHRLQLWAGDAYVREPSGTGFWANVGVSFGTKHKEVTVPVTLNITRVEGGT